MRRVGFTTFDGLQFEASLRGRDLGDEHRLHAELRREPRTERGRPNHLDALKRFAGQLLQPCCSRPPRRAHFPALSRRYLVQRVA